ncbi:MAG: efflux RND transporter periplasmic adaptor subunit [Candidatus Parcubacteria bacterium]|nr:efflux RND transporter periplasmic adaptor subunit [Candidatus Parcubacteria bacterium]
MFKKIFQFILKHKILISLIGIGLIIGGYFVFKSLTSTPAAAHYVIATVEKGTLITSVSGTGQISVTNQVDVKAKASGDLYNVPIVAGQEVKTGAILAQINAKDALKSVRDAKANLDSAKLSLEKLQEPADQLSITQAQNALAQAQEAKQQAEDDLKKSYDDGFNTVSNVFLQLPNIITGLEDVLFGNELGGSSQWNIDYYANAVPFDEAKIFEYKELTLKSAQAARAEFDKNFSDYKTANRFSDISVIEALLDETYNTSKIFSEAIKNTNNYIQFYEDALARHNQKPDSAANTQLATLNTYTGQVNTHLQNLLSIINTIASDKTSIVNSESTIIEKSQSLAKLQADIDPLDLKTQELSIQQRQNALWDASEKLADYTVRAPFDGVIAVVSVKKGDSISSGTSIATLITQQKTAEISLNEVDVSKIKIGQKATLTFDAIDGLSITGEVAEIDTLGTVTQGVVTYNVKIIFDTQDERVKLGMSASAAIITDSKQDVLLLPNSAIKSFGTTSYVEMPNEEIPASDLNNKSGITLKNPLRQQPIEIGLANDSQTEVTDGLKEGDQIITQTINSNASTTQTQSSALRIPGIGGGGFRGN